MRLPTTTPGSEPPPAAVEHPERWSVQRKTELVLRLLRGEALDAISRESQVAAHELEAWKRVFLEQGTPYSRFSLIPIFPTATARVGSDDRTATIGAAPTDRGELRHQGVRICVDTSVITLKTGEALG